MVIILELIRTPAHRLVALVFEVRMKQKHDGDMSLENILTLYSTHYPIA
jgi:hypothetical protein